MYINVGKDKKWNECNLHVKQGDISEICRKRIKINVSRYRSPSKFGKKGVEETVFKKA